MAARRSSHNAWAWGVTRGPAQATVMPWRMAAGVLGMARTMAASGPSRRVMPEIDWPAMIDSITAWPA